MQTSETPFIDDQQTLWIGVQEVGFVQETNGRWTLATYEWSAFGVRDLAADSLDELIAQL